jgi:sugar phosphate isomerase/epimerase
MRIGIFAKTFPGTDPQTVLAEVAGAGFATTQYNMSCSGLPSMPEAIDADLCEAIRIASAACGVEIVALSATFNMIHPDPAVRETGLRRLAVLARAAPAMGAGLVTLCTGTRDPDDQWRAHPDNATPGAWRDLLRSMEAAVRIAEDCGVDLGVEPELANVVSSAAAARRLIDALASRRVKIVFDAANLFEVATDSARRAIVSEGLDLLGDRIAIAHAKDRRPDGAFAAAGTGVLDYRHYVSELRRVGFRGGLVAHGLEARDAPRVAAFLSASLAATAAA